MNDVGARRSVRRLPEVELEELAELDAHAFWLARGRGRTRLRIGDALAALGAGFQELGFSSLGAYARERASRSGAWAMETRRLSERLAALPLLRAALEEGRIDWCMAELCARHASGGVVKEAEVLELARSRTVSAMRKVLRERAAEAGDAKRARDAEGEERRTVMLSVALSAEDAWALTATRWLVRHMDGGASSLMGRDGWLDALLAEGQTTLCEMGAGRDEDLLPAEVALAHARWRASIEAGLAKAARREEEAERRISFGEVEAGEAREAEPLPSSVNALDGVIRDLSAELAGRDLYLGRVLLPFFAARGWARLGYASEAQYARERLGMSRASVRAKMALARAAESLGAVEDAVHAGRLGYAHAALVARVATKETVAAWVERATRRTYKHLREEVEAVELFARFLGRDKVPPDDDEIAAVQDLERAVLSGECAPVGLEGVPVQRSVDGDEAMGGGPTVVPVQRSVDGDEAMGAEPPVVPVQRSVGREEAMGAGPTVVPVQTSMGCSRTAASVTMRFAVDEDVALHYRQLEAAHERAGSPGGSFPRFLCLSMFLTWAGHLGKSDSREMTYRRDLYRCPCPVCDSRNVTCHHTDYIGRGGPDVLWNTIAACVFCHLFGEHGGRLRVRGVAPDKLTWWIGREPILRIEGRELVWAA